MLLAGRRKEFRRRDFLDYFGREKLQLPENLIEQTLQELQSAKSVWQNVLQTSFLNESLQSRYLRLIEERFQRLYT